MDLQLKWNLFNRFFKFMSDFTFPKMYSKLCININNNINNNFISLVLHDSFTPPYKYKIMYLILRFRFHILILIESKTFVK